MSIEKKDIEYIKKTLDECHNPLFFFDDDADGLCSFLLFYRYKREGHGIPVKARSKMVTEMMLRKVREYSPDIVFILDSANVDDEFIEKSNVPIIWIDHHPFKQKKGVKYFNPLLGDPKDNSPTSYWCYKVVEDDMWIAMIGCIGDYFVPDFLKEFQEKYPDLLEKGIKTPDKVLFETKIGLLTRIFWFNLKGKSSDVSKSIKVLTRIEDPYEILEAKTARGSFIKKRFEKINTEYEKLMQETKPEIIGRIKIFNYPESKSSMTSFLSNELQYKNPNDVILVCRLKSGEYKCSMRSNKIKLDAILKKALTGIKGYGGGHKHAVGCVIKQDYFDTFKKNLLELINKK